MKLSSIIVLFISFLPLINAQYKSGVTYPNTDEAIITDSTNLSIKYSHTITEEELKEHLSILASDEYEGRETGEKGNDLAADYLAKQFEELGLDKAQGQDNYFQNVAFSFTRWNEVSLQVNETKYKHLWDYIVFPTRNQQAIDFNEKEIVFLGYGIEAENYSDYKGKSVKGKTILIYSGDPKDKNGNSRITGEKSSSEWTADKKLILAKEKGAKMVLIIEPDIKKFLEENRRLLLGGSMELGDKSKEEPSYPNHVYISSSIAKELMINKFKKTIKSRDRITKKGKSCQVEIETDLKIQMDKKLTVLYSQNVLGYLEGTDKKEELIVVSAHYDHIGKKGKDVFNGADDNGTGTCTVLELAEAFKKASDEGNGPRRSILFLLVTGEEKGLLGSEYYSSNPIYPLENTMANVNIDMIGRIDDNHDHSNYIYVIGSDRLSSDLHEINETINQKYTQMQLDYTYNDENDPNRYYYRSDHYNFAKNGIPSVFFFSGTHKDYHRPSDTIEKIMFDKLARTAKHIFHLSWELANRDNKITVD